MTISPLNKWQNDLALVPQVNDPSWSQNIANWYASEMASISPDPTYLIASGFLFVFPAPIFASGLASAVPSTAPEVGTQIIATAWETAMLSVVYPASLFLAPGTIQPPASPATTFSAITSVIINPASLQAGKAKILQLSSAKVVKNAKESAMATKLREATMQLKIDITGLNSVAPTPAPLVVAGVPLI